MVDGPVVCVCVLGEAGSVELVFQRLAGTWPPTTILWAQGVLGQRFSPVDVVWRRLRKCEHAVF